MLELFSTIVIATILGFGLALVAPISIYFAFNFDRRPTVAVGVQFLIFKHHFSKKKKKEKSETETKNDRTKKSRPAKKSRPLDKTVIRQPATLIRERETIRQTLALFAGFAKQLVLSTDRYYIQMNLNGGLRSPDLTGQLYGLVQACKSIPSDSLSLSFHPDFIEDKLSGTIAVGTAFRIYKIIYQLLIFIWRLPKIKLIKLYRNYRKETGDV